MTLRDELQDLVEHVPAGMKTVTVEVDWLRRQLEDADGSDPDGEDDGAGTYLTTAEAARRLSVQPETVARWSRDGRFPNAFKTDPAGEGGEWRIPVGDVRRLSEKEQVKTERVHFTRN